MLCTIAQILFSHPTLVLYAYVLTYYRIVHIHITTKQTFDEHFVEVDCYMVKVVAKELTHI